MTELTRVRLWVSTLNVLLVEYGFTGYMNALGSFDKLIGKPVEHEIPPFGC